MKEYDLLKVQSWHFFFLLSTNSIKKKRQTNSELIRLTSILCVAKV